MNIYHHGLINAIEVFSGRYASFRGMAGDKIFIPDVLAYNPATGIPAITIEFWTRVNAFGMSIPVSSDDLYFNADFTDNMLFSYRSQSSQFLMYSGQKVKLNNWNHIAFTFDGTAKCFYIDGKLKVQNNSTTNVFTYSNTNDLTFGLYSADEAYAPHKGDLAEVRVWDYARTQQQLKDNWYKAVAPQTGLVARWPLAHDAQDVSGNGHHGTISGTVTFNGPNI